MEPAPWATELNRWLDEGGELDASKWEHARVTTGPEAALLVTATQRVRNWAHGQVFTQEELISFLSLFRQVESTQAYMHLAMHAMPHLVGMFDDLQKQPKIPADASSLLLVLFAAYGHEDGWSRIATAAGDPALCNLWCWDGFIPWPDARDPIVPELLKRLPPGTALDAAAVSVVSWMNRLGREDDLTAHPYAAPVGIEILREWLSVPAVEEREIAAARAAAGAIPFLSPETQEALLALAESQESPLLQLEALWARGWRGETDAIDRLLESTEDDEWGPTAIALIDDLGEGSRISEAARRRFAEFHEEEDD